MTDALRIRLHTLSVEVKLKTETKISQINMRSSAELMFTTDQSPETLLSAKCL